MKRWLTNDSQPFDGTILKARHTGNRITSKNTPYYPIARINKTLLTKISFIITHTEISDYKNKIENIHSKRNSSLRFI